MAGQNSRLRRQRQQLRFGRADNRREVAVRLPGMWLKRQYGRDSRMCIRGSQRLNSQTKNHRKTLRTSEMSSIDVKGI